MLRKIKKIWNTEWGRFFLSPLIKPLLFLEKKLISDKKAIELKYKSVFGKNIMWENPQTLNEKINWKKLYDRKNIYIGLTDKYKVRNYIKDKIGEKYLIPLYFHTKNPKKICVEKLPKKFILKPNHGSGENMIVYDKSKVSKKEIIKKSKKFLKNNFYPVCREWQYKDIKPRILIEKLLLNKEGNIPFDYKFHCINGKVEMIQVDEDRFGNHKRSYFDKNWKLLPFTYCLEKNGKPIYEIDKNIKKPKKLKEMLRLAKKLSEDFDYVRVDLYNIGEEVYFGELTFTHGGGYEKFFPEKYDRIYGDKLKMNNEKNGRKRC